MPDRIGDAETRRAGVDRGLKQTAQRLGVGPRRVLGDVHHLQALAHAKADRLFGAALQVVDRPVFRVDANRARADEAAALDRQAGLLHDVGDRLNVGQDGARGAVGLHAEAALEDLAGQPLDVASHVRPGARQPDVGGVDADTVEQVQDAELLIDGRCAHRGRLQSVAKRLVEEQDLAGPRARRIAIPVEDQSIMSTCSSRIVTSIIEVASAGPSNLEHRHEAPPATGTRRAGAPPG